MDILLDAAIVCIMLGTAPSIQWQYNSMHWFIMILDQFNITRVTWCYVTPVHDRESLVYVSIIALRLIAFSRFQFKWDPFFPDRYPYIKLEVQKALINIIFKILKWAIDEPYVGWVILVGYETISIHVHRWTVHHTLAPYVNPMCMYLLDLCLW